MHCINAPSLAAAAAAVVVVAYFFCSSASYRAMGKIALDDTMQHHQLLRWSVSIFQENEKVIRIKI